MQFVAVSTNTKDVSPYIHDEFARVTELREAGVIVDGWVKADFSGAVLVLEGDDVDEVVAALDSLPIVRNGGSDMELIAVVDLDAAGAALRGDAVDGE